MKIKILNQVFNVQDTVDEEYMKKLARYVEDKVTYLQRATNTIDSHRLALLAALHIADEYFQLRNQYQELDKFISKKSAEFVKILDQFTEDSPN